MIVDTLRPSSVRKTGAATTVPSGTLSAVTSDNSDATYIQYLNNAVGNWNLRLQPHVLTAGYQRHAIRGRIRSSSDAGTVTEDIDVGRGDSDYLQFASNVPIGVGFADYATNWFQAVTFGLAETGTISNFNVGGGWVRNAADGATMLRTAEVYVDIDTRFHPDFSPEVQDNSGVDQSGGTITDTNQPVLYFGAVAYDGLPELDWTVTLQSGADVLLNVTGSGAPPASVPVTDPLPDGSYTATFTVRSTIRGTDPFAYSETLTFGIQNIVPPPSPPLVTVTEQDGGYLVSWVFPGGQPWDDDYAVAEIWRDDCTGSQRIATIPDGLNGSYFDLAIPQLDPQPGPDCELSSIACDVTYRVRYWGYVSASIVVPDSIPDGLILGWPGTVGTIPGGWNRVTDLDTRYPRGATTTGAPTATGGAVSHSHTTPSHTHALAAHTHAVGGSTAITGGSVNTRIVSDGGLPRAPAVHTHTRPANTGITVGSFSGAAAPGTNTVANLPPTRDVIWVASAGGQSSFPAGLLGFSIESISGWTDDAASSDRYLRGAPAAGNGGASAGASNHTHTVNAHTHTGANHEHSIGDTGLDNPLQPNEIQYREGSSQFLARHTHPMDVAVANTGTLNSAGGGTTGVTSLEPPHRRVRVLRNTVGTGIQTRVIGLWTGTVASLPASLKLCNGSNGTPDMRTWFARQAGFSSVNTTGGTTAHTHTVPNHTHTVPSHTHGITVGTSRTRQYPNYGSAPTVDAAPANHTHPSSNTAAASPPASSTGAGTTGSTSHLPLYREVHFVRLDGVVTGGPLPVPELRISEFASTTVPAFTYTDGMDRLATLTLKVAVPTDRTHDFPRSITDSVPLTGGLHTVSSVPGGEDMSLTIAVEGKAAIDELEQVLSATRVYYSPLGGTPGWYAPAGWTTANPSPNVWAVSVPLVRQPWPDVEAPEAYL